MSTYALLDIGSENAKDAILIKKKYDLFDSCKLYGSSSASEWHIYVLMTGPTKKKLRGSGKIKLSATYADMDGCVIEFDTCVCCVKLHGQSEHDI